MYIRRKEVFSVLDTEIGERLFSTTDYILDQREFAESDENVKSPQGNSLDRHDSLSEAVGVYAGKKYAEELDREGKSDEEIIKGARNRAALVGGGVGAVEGAAAGTLGAIAAKKAANKIGKKLIKSRALSPLGIRRVKYVLRSGLSKSGVGGIIAAGSLGMGLGHGLRAADQAKKDTKERLESRK